MAGSSNAIGNTISDKVGVAYVNDRLAHFAATLERQHDRIRGSVDSMFGSEPTPPTPNSDRPAPTLVVNTTSEFINQIQAQLQRIEYQISRLAGD